MHWLLLLLWLSRSGCRWLTCKLHQRVSDSAEPAKSANEPVSESIEQATAFLVWRSLNRYSGNELTDVMQLAWKRSGRSWESCLPCLLSARLCGYSKLSCRSVSGVQYVLLLSSVVLHVECHSLVCLVCCVRVRCLCSACAFVPAFVPAFVMLIINN